MLIRQCSRDLEAFLIINNCAIDPIVAYQRVAEFFGRDGQIAPVRNICRLLINQLLVESTRLLERSDRVVDLLLDTEILASLRQIGCAIQRHRQRLGENAGGGKDQQAYRQKDTPVVRKHGAMKKGSGGGAGGWGGLSLLRGGGTVGWFVVIFT